MKRSTRIRIALALVLATALGGCGKQDDAITKAAKKDVAADVSAPGIAETKTIAEEGSIYGLPIVMNSGAARSRYRFICM